MEFKKLTGSGRKVSVAAHRSTISGSIAQHVLKHEHEEKEREATTTETTTTTTTTTAKSRTNHNNNNNNNNNNNDHDYLENFDDLYGENMAIAEGRISHESETEIERTSVISPRSVVKGMAKRRTSIDMTLLEKTGIELGGGGGGGGM
tara:strand:- start:398 stop:841 length:444 start_codon:yes stop_codon:yes gene_type:complete